METLTIDVLNNKAIRLLQDLENMQLIRVRKEEPTISKVNWSEKYKGAMTKQTPTEIEEQLKEIRNEWE